MKKILYLLLTTEKYKSRQDNVLQSWGNGVDLFFYSEHEDLNRNVIKVTDLNNVEEKQIKVFKTIQDLFYNKYEWYFFGDDDTFVNTTLLEKEIDNYDKTKIHGSDIYGCWNDLHYPSGGAGFIIHNNIINNFFESKNFNVGYSDVTFGLNMREKKLELSNNDKFLSQHLNYYNIPLENANQYITFHYVNNNEEFLFFEGVCKNNVK
jgi:hypothetical protein